uniref:Ovule protein n=1 Tax=Angiostrongylus costaricensis TaxID=334426 RepID=A0A0R3PWU2_ANGCS
LFCPVPIVGTRCPGSSVFHYYKCCGDLNKDCCFNLQVLISIFRILDDASYLSRVFAKNSDHRVGGLPAFRLFPKSSVFHVVVLMEIHAAA